MGEGPDDDPSATKAAMRDERETLAEVEKALEKCVAENAKLRLESSEKDKTSVKFRRKIREKDVKIQELRNERGRLNDELDRLLEQDKKKSFTLKQLVNIQLEHTFY